jgi:hypothetical protein
VPPLDSSADIVHQLRVLDVECGAGTDEDAVLPIMVALTGPESTMLVTL